jgi:CubicO group peptidase (beta-lactamase class C family)
VSRLGRLDAARLTAGLEADAFSGVVHVVGDEGEPPLTIALGPADRVTGIQNDPRLRYGVASISKLITGLTCARLVDRDALSWDTRYAELVDGDWRPVALDPSVTMRHLVGHTSGFGDYYDEEGDEPYEALWTRVPSAAIRGPKDMFPLLRDLPQHAEPGTRTLYNNGAFVLAGIALEELTGRRFPDLVRREVFEPLAMARSAFWALDDVVPDLAVGYLRRDESNLAGDAGPWRTNVMSLPAMGGPDGCVQSTVADLVRLLDGLTGRGEPGASFLSAATRGEVIGPHAVSMDGVFRFGLGVLHVGDGPSHRFGHTGEDPGASARAWTYPTSGERVAVVSNVTRGAGPVTQRIDALLAGA